MEYHRPINWATSQLYSMARLNNIFLLLVRPFFFSFCVCVTFRLCNLRSKRAGSRREDKAVNEPISRIYCLKNFYSDRVSNSDLPGGKPLRYRMSQTFVINGHYFQLYIYLLMEIVPWTVTSGAWVHGNRFKNIQWNLLWSFPSLLLPVNEQ